MLLCVLVVGVAFGVVVARVAFVGVVVVNVVCAFDVVVALAATVVVVAFCFC